MIPYLPPGVVMKDLLLGGYCLRKTISPVRVSLKVALEVDSQPLRLATDKGQIGGFLGHLKQARSTVFLEGKSRRRLRSTGERPLSEDARAAIDSRRS